MARDCHLFVLLLIFSHPASGMQAQADSLLQILDTSRSRKVKAELSIELSKIFLSTSLEKTKKYALVALENATEKSPYRLQAYNQLAKYYFFLNQLDSAHSFFAKVLEANKKKNDRASIAAVNTSIGAVLLRQAKYEDAISTFIQCIDYFESVGDEISSAKCYNNIASAHAELYDYPEAIKWSLKALDIFDAHEVTNFKLITLPNLATQYAKSGDTVKAIDYFEQAVDLGTRNNNKRSLAISFNNLGDLYLSVGNLNQAQTHFEQSVILKEQLGIRKGIDNAYHNLGHIFAQKGKHRQAINWYNKAIRSSDPKSAIVIYERLKDSHKALGELSKAVGYAELSIKLKDSINQLSNTRNFAEISEKYQSTQRENKILQLANQNQKLAFARDKTMGLLLGATGLLLLTLLVGLLYFTNVRKKQVISNQMSDLRQQKMLEKLKEHELETIDRIVQVQNEERSRIAADLHDSLGSKLAAMKLYLDELEAVEDLSIRSSAERANHLAKNTYDEIRNISHSLRLGVHAEQGLLPALHEMADHINQTNALKVKLIDLEVKQRLENHIEIQLFRVIQELITNTLKHANANEIIIHISQHDETLGIIFEDDGQGFDLQSTKLGMGLLNVERRLDDIEAEYQLDSAPGNGTTVVINI